VASRQSDALKLVARARLVGWDVSQGDGGVWKIKCPDGVSVQVHQTPSDRNSTAVTLRELNRHGLAEAERALKAQTQAQRTAKLEAERRRSETALAKASAQATLRAKAAGPYAPTVVTLEQILAHHPVPVTWHQVSITPEMASALLERNSHNRPIRPADVRRYATSLRNDRWRYTHAGVALDSLGVLQDGQQRLKAIVETGITALMMVSAGMDPDNFAIIDTGRRRTAAQALTLAGAKYASWASGAARILHLYQTWGADMLTHLNEPVDNDVILAVHASLDPDVLAQACKDASLLNSEIRVGPMGALAAFYAIRATSSRPAHVELAQAFVEAVIYGTGRDDPLYALHRQLVRQAMPGVKKMNAAELFGLLLKGWAAFVTTGKVTTSMISRSSKRTLVPSPIPIVERTDG
jgi:hypothetical protein